MYDSEDTEGFDLDVPAAMGGMTYAERPPDDGDGRSVNAVNMAPVGRTVSRVARCEVDKSSDMSGTDTARLEEVKLCNASYTISSYEDVAYMGDFVDEDFMDTGFYSDIGSEAEFRCTTRGDACAWESWRASGNSPPDSAGALAAVSVKDVVYYRNDSKCQEGDVCYTGIHTVCCKDRYADGDRYRLCLLRRPSRRDIGVWNYDNVTIDSRTEWGLKHSFTIDWYVDSTDTSPSAVCYDCLCLIGFFRTVKSLFHDEEETQNHLGYVPRCLCLPLVVDGMTQSLKFKGPGCGLIVSETGYTGGRRCVCTGLTPPGICPAGEVRIL